MSPQVGVIDKRIVEVTEGYHGSFEGIICLYSRAVGKAIARIKEKDIRKTMMTEV